MLAKYGLGQLCPARAQVFESCTVYLTVGIQLMHKPLNNTCATATGISEAEKSYVHKSLSQYVPPMFLSLGSVGSYPKAS